MDNLKYPGFLSDQPDSSNLVQAGSDKQEPSPDKKQTNSVILHAINILTPF